MSRALRRAAVVAVAAALAGCGAGAGDAPDEVKLTVTENFGAETVLDRPGPQVQGGDTVMRLLQRNAKVETKYGGGFVHAIDGRAGGRENGRTMDWFFFVNGVLSDRGAGAVDVHAGDRIWWDRHDWSVTGMTPAVVGSFPEPFVHGFDGERRPLRLECDEAVEDACDVIVKRMADLGVVAGKARPGTEWGEENVRILVGRWSVVRRDRAVEQIERGPRASGVYARVSKDGRTITALDPTGRAARRLGAGTGLIAATRWREDGPTWVVTGTDEAGVRVAAEQGMQESVLNEKFALAISDGLPVPLPVTERAP